MSQKPLHPPHSDDAAVEDALQRAYRIQLDSLRPGPEAPCDGDMVAQAFRRARLEKHLKMPGDELRRRGLSCP